jgi:hypothetical protein
VALKLRRPQLGGGFSVLWGGLASRLNKHPLKRRDRNAIAPANLDDRDLTAMGGLIAPILSEIEIALARLHDRYRFWRIIPFERSGVSLRTAPTLHGGAPFVGYDFSIYLRKLEKVIAFRLHQCFL